LGDVASIEKEVKIEKLVKRYVNVTLVKSGIKEKENHYSNLIKASIRI